MTTWAYYWMVDDFVIRFGYVSAVTSQQAIEIAKSRHVHEHDWDFSVITIKVTR